MWGKIFGALFGSMFAGPIGFLLGLAIGHVFDKGLEMQSESAPVSFAQKVFFSTTFEMMGYIAKVDGRVSEREIQTARDVMAYLQLTQEQKMLAIQYFNLGKSPQFNAQAAIEHFIKNCGQHRQLVQLFIEIQMQAAFVDDGLENPYKRHVIENLCDQLHVPRIILRQMEAQFYAQQAFRQGAYYQSQRSHQRTHQRTHYTPHRPVDELANAYRLLGIAKDATNQEVKKAYRQLMSQNHPDKLVAKGLPEEMIKIATEKTQAIQKAYELVCQARGM